MTRGTSVVWYQTEPQDGMPDLDCQTGHIHVFESSIVGALNGQCVKLVKFKGYGYADLELRVPASPETLSTATMLYPTVLAHFAAHQC